MPKYEEYVPPTGSKYEEYIPVNPGSASDASRGLPTRGDKIDAALGGASALGATLATLPFTGPAAVGFGALARAATVRALAAGAGGATGSLVKSGVQTALDTPGKPANKADVINRALEGGVQEFAGQTIGEVLGGVLPVGVAIGRAAVRQAPKSMGGQRFYKTKWDDLQKANDALALATADAAATTMQTLGKHVEQHEIGEIGQEGFSKFRRVFLDKEREQFRAFEESLASSKIDYTDVAKDLINLEKSRPKAKGGLKVLTEGDTKWEELVNAMREGQKARPGATDPLLTGRAMLPPLNSAEAGDAVVRARSAVSTRLQEIEAQRLGLAEGYTKEYVEGLRDLKARLDQKIRGAAFETDPLLGAGYDKLMKFSGDHREVLKQTFVGMAENKKGDLAKNLLSANHPEWVDTFKMAVKEGSITPSQQLDVQRAALESLLLRTKSSGEKVIDIENFATRMDNTGAAGRRLFSDPAAANTVNNLKTMSKEIKGLPKTPQAAGIPYTGDTAEGKFYGMMASVVGFKLTNMVFLPREAYALMNSGIVKVASNPAAFPKFMRAVKMAEAAGKWSPTATNLAVDALRTAKVYEGLKMALATPQMAPSH
jgi:hypothetical protein